MVSTHNLVPYSRKPSGVSAIRNPTVPFPDSLCSPITSTGRLLNFATRGYAPSGTLAGSPLPVWKARGGIVIESTQAFGSNRIHFADSSKFLPTVEVTVVFGYRKTDGTNRASSAFGVFSNDANDRCGSHIPFSDGVVYWDFGGASGSSRLTASGLTFGNDVWCFTAGARGMEIWQNGFLRASQTAHTTRISATNDFVIFSGNGDNSGVSSDLAQCSLIYVYSKQLPRSVCRSLCMNPWQIFAFRKMSVASSGALSVLKIASVVKLQAVKRASFY